MSLRLGNDFTRARLPPLVPPQWSNVLEALVMASSIEVEERKKMNFITLWGVVKEASANNDSSWLAVRKKRERTSSGVVDVLGKQARLDGGRSNRALLLQQQGVCVGGAAMGHHMNMPCGLPPTTMAI